jgi:muramoyltetrapeptide carboxypeptidase
MLAPRLKPGDVIAVFSPSAPVTANTPVRYLRGKTYLENQGFRVLEGALTGKRDFYRSGSIAARAEELNALLRNPDVRCVMASIGGMNSNSMLPYLDYDAIRRDPKIIIGYSDVTALLLGIYARTGLTTYYGPAMAASFGEFPPLVDETFRYFETVVCGKAEPPHRLPTPEAWTDEFVDWKTQSGPKSTRPNQLVTVHGGTARGRLIGGNLNTMTGIWGSPYLPEIRPGDLLLIEDCLEDAADIERSFSLLKINGVFDRIGGLILGKHEKFNDCGSGRAPWQILQEVMGEVDFPVLAEFDCCHTHPMLTLPIGVTAELDADAKTLTLTEPFIG